MDEITLAVNGTLMRGLSLNKNLLDQNEEFVPESKTSSEYRMWSIQDEYPAMHRDEKEGKKIDVELWKLSSDSLIPILLSD